MAFSGSYCALPARDSFGKLVHGVWNLRFNNKWYHSYRCYVHQDDRTILRKLKLIYANEIDLEEWVEIPFPVPLWNTLSRMVSVNLEIGMVMIRGWKWDEKRNGTMTVTEADLATVCNRDELNVEDWCHVSVQYAKSSSSEEGLIPKFPVELSPEIEPPTIMFELQQRFFFDFIFLWKGFIDDPFT
ncbi:hypothetical protein N7488_008760 [Penicillium malachiteum]|nr:hypothetical protein N7488_008760 [Penicillium malachiteum]